MDDLAAITREMIDRAYFRLKNTPIDTHYVTEEEMGDAFFCYGVFPDGKYFIEVHPSLKDAPHNVVCGGLAHGLTHIEEDITFDPESALFDERMYNESEQYRVLSERNTDINIIIKGLGNELLAFLEWAEPRRTIPYESDMGLSSVELKMIIRNHASYPFAEK